MNSVRNAIAGLCLVFGALSASAAIVSVDGDNVRFTYDNSTLYGSAIVVGDAILFTPTGFAAESLNGSGLDQEIEMLNIQVEIITAGYWLEDFQLVEQGDYILDGAGATAAVSGIFEVSSNTNANVESNSFDAGPLTVQGALTEWSAGSMISLGDTPGWATDTDVDLDITNTLSATTSAPGEQSRVQKKLGGVGIQITAVPVPAAVWLFGSGLVGLLGWARRKTAT